MAAGIWNGYISFGLVSIPISLSPAARGEHIAFHQLHSECLTRLKQPLFCPYHNRIVERSEVVKGYEYEKGKYLVFSPEELKRIEPQSARAMEILEFVKLDDVDPIYFEASYYVAPQQAGAHAYHLLLSAMRKSGYAGIAKVTMHNREYTVILRARDGGLTLHTMFYANEVRAAKGLGDQEKTTVKEPEEKLALELIKNLAGPFQPEKYHDTYQENLRKLIEAKAEGKTIAAVPQKKVAPVIDIMSALKQSLSHAAAGAGPKSVSGQKQAARAVAHRSEHARKRRKAS